MRRCSRLTGAIRSISLPIALGKGAKKVALPLVLALLAISSLPAGAIARDLDEQFNIRGNDVTPKEARDEADFLLRLGGQQERLGHLDKAIYYWMQALEIYHRIGDVKSEGLTYDFIGIAYAALGRYDLAEDALRRRLAIARDNKDILGEIYGLNNVGTVLVQREAIDEARKVFEEAYEIARSVNSLEGQGLSLSNLGLIAATKRDYNQAIKRYEAALTWRRRAADPTGEANTLNNLGDAYRAAGNYDEAIANYGSARLLARQSVDFRNHFRAIDGLVAAHSSVGRYFRAAALLDERLELAQKIENPRQELISLRSIAQFYRILEDYPVAEEFYRRAIALARDLGDLKEETRLLDELQLVWRAKETHKSGR